MKSLNFLFFIFQFIRLISGDTPQFSQLEIKDARLANPTHFAVTTLERRKKSTSDTKPKTNSEKKPNPAVCPVGVGRPVKADLNDCTKIATHLASHRKLTCGVFKTCIIMTRAGVNDPQPFKFYTKTQFRYYVQLIFKDACKVARPVDFRKDAPKPSPDDFIWITAGFPVEPLKDEQVQTCDQELFKFMAALPLPQ